MNPLIAAGTASYAALAAVGFLRPAAVPELFGGTAPTAASRNEIRAVYGGMTLALAAVGTRAPVAAGILSSGLAAGRSVSALVEPETTDPATRFFIGAEVALAAAYFVGARQRSRRP